MVKRLPWGADKVLAAVGLDTPNLQQEAPHWLVQRLPWGADKVLAAVGLGKS
jgi:hypothetical protein